MRWLVLVGVAACSSSNGASITNEDLAGHRDLSELASHDLAGVDLVSQPGVDLAQLQRVDMGHDDLAGAHDMASAQQQNGDMLMCLAPLATCTDASQCCYGYGCSSYNGNPQMKCWQGLGQPCMQDLDCKPQTDGTPTCLDPSGNKICCVWTVTANGCGAGRSKFCHECSPGVTICDPC